ncbi:MAG TPA: TonB-dependent receptor [Vicinamibacterales bacterium]|nr:TonB-dependent receptor [Vicinamibacterales bacterium]
MMSRAVSEDGDTFVMQAGPELKVLGRSSLGEMTLASRAVADGSVFIRTATKLYRIARRSNNDLVQHLVRRMSKMREAMTMTRRTFFGRPCGCNAHLLRCCWWIRCARVSAELQGHGDRYGPGLERRGRARRHGLDRAGSTGLAAGTTTSSEGTFALPQLPPGRYELTIELAGFRKFVQRGLVLETDQTRRVEARLELGSIAEAVTVEAKAAVINTDTSNKGEVITPRQLADLPLNGRNYSELALLVPGIYRRPTDDDQGEGLATSGTRTDASNFILDGVINRSDRNASAGVNAGVDAIREFNVQTSTYSAEYGRTAGAQINVVSKSGTNTIAGSIFEYLRDDAFDANNYFTQPGDDKSLRRHQFGGTVGGPVRRDRTFYFLSYEHTYERRSETRNTTAPQADWLRGDFRNGRGAGPNGIWGDADDTNRIVNPFTRAEFATPNVIPDSMFHAISRQMLPFIPAANVPGGVETYNTNGLSRTNRNQVLTKVDHRLSHANNLFVRWARQWSDGYDPFPSDRNFYPGFGRDTVRRNDSLAISDTHIFSGTLLNEARIGMFDQRNENLGEHRDTDVVAHFGIPGLSITPELQGWPAIRIDGYSEFGDRPNDPFIYDIQNVQFFDMTTWVRDRQNFKLGVDVIRSNYVEADVRNVRGDFRFRGRNTNPSGGTSSGFRSFADFLLGLPDATQRVRARSRAPQRTGRPGRTRRLGLRAEARVSAVPVGTQSWTRRQRRLARSRRFGDPGMGPRSRPAVLRRARAVPGARIEYVDVDGRLDHVDIEVVTLHYRGAHGAAASQSGFSTFRGSTARTGGSPFDPDYASEVFR